MRGVFLLTGQLDFEADTSMKVLMHHLNTAPVRSLRTELPVPRELDELALACLKKNPAQRPQNAGELVRMGYNCRSCEGSLTVTAGKRQTTGMVM